MNFFGIRIEFPWERKVSAADAAIVIQYRGQRQGVYHRRNQRQYATEGFQKNSVVYMCVSKIAKSCAAIPIAVFDGDEELTDGHPVVDLLRRPNPSMGWQKLAEGFLSNYVLSGNGYLEGVSALDGRTLPIELWPLMSSRVRVRTNDRGIDGYVYEVNGMLVSWNIDQATMSGPIMHMSTWNPVDDYYGMSPIEAAALAIDQHTEASAWNQALLQNSARPTGALVYASENGATLTDKQREMLREELAKTSQGSGNAGRPLLLEGGLDWKNMGMTPVEMDWLNGKAASAREICSVFQVAPQLLGLPGDSTYSNFQEARQSFYEETCIPIYEAFLGSLSAWLASPSGVRDLRIVAKHEGIPAMQVKRQMKLQGLAVATWMTINEKRKEAGLPPIGSAEADQILIPAGLVPLDQDHEPDPQADAAGKNDSMDLAFKALSEIR